jgi:hypothetical protein
VRQRLLGRESRITANRDLVSPIIIAHLNLLQIEDEFFQDADPTCTFYTARIQRGSIHNARMIGILHGDGGATEGHYVWLAEDDTAYDIAVQWFAILWNMDMTDEDMDPINWPPVFTTTDKKVIQWFEPFKQQSGTHILHVQ